MLGASVEASALAARQPLINGRIDETQRVTLLGNVRPDANASNDRGQVDDATPLNHLQLVLVRPAELEAALQDYMQAAQTPGKPNYHMWLTAEEIGTKYGPDSGDIAAVRGWLESHGLRVNSVSASGMMVDFSGTAREVAETFKTEIHNLEVNGERHMANMRNPQIPAALAPVVAGIASLNDFRPHPMMKPRSASTAIDPTHDATKPAYTGDPGYGQMVVPADLATIYNFNPVYESGVTGKGETIVLIEDSDLYSNQDYFTFRKTFGLDRYKDSKFSVVHPGGCIDPGVNQADSEATLDAQWAAAAAPDANIVVASCADSTDTFGGFIALQGLVDSRSPPAIVSVSYGYCETYIGATGNRYINALYQQAAAEGVSVYVSAGDEGAASCDANQPDAQGGIAVSGFASTPYNLAAGGTDYSDSYSGTNSQYWSSTNTATYGSAKSYIPEMPWDDSCANEPLFTAFGYATAYGTSGFCNSEIGETYFLTTGAGSGGPSGCAYGATNPNVGTPVVSGTCRGYAKPIWQRFLAGVPQDGVRDIPDVSLFAANGVWGHYYVSCYSDPAYGGTPCTGPPETWSGNGGGTSFVSPILAGVQALLNQKTGFRQGNPDYAYYALATLEYGLKGKDACDSNAGTNACIFHDVTFGDIDVNCEQTLNNGTADCYQPSGSNGVLSVSASQFKSAYAAAKGWDFATGIGTLNVEALVNAWARIY